MARGATSTKARILQMARNLYSTHGCEGTTLEDILTAAGVTKGAFYHYFKSKESLCETIIEQVTADYRQLAMTLDADAEPIDQLRGMIAEAVMPIAATGSFGHLSGLDFLKMVLRKCRWIDDNRKTVDKDIIGKG